MPRNRMSLAESLQESSKKGSGFENLVFKQNVNVRFQKKDTATTFRILPTIFRDIDGNPDKSNYFAYRDVDDRFTDWVVVFKQHRFVGQKLTILSPHFFTGVSVEDPIERLWEVANSDPRFYEYIGKNSEGKTNRDSYKTALLRAPDWRAAMNTIDPNDVENPEKVSIMVVSKGAIFRKNYQNLPDQDSPPSSPWGLADQLDILNREDLVAADVPQSDFSSRFVKGDITDPVRNGRRGGLAVCMVRMEDPPQGGIQNYNCKVLDHPRTQGNPTILEGRYDFETETFVELELGDYMDRVTAVLKGLTDDLLYAAWENRGPHYQEALSRAGIGSGISRVPGAPMMGRRPSAEAQMPAPRLQPAASQVDDGDDVLIEPETPPVSITRPLAPPPGAVPRPRVAGVTVGPRPATSRPMHEGGMDLPAPQMAPSATMRRRNVSSALQDSGNSEAQEVS